MTLLKQYWESDLDEKSLAKLSRQTKETIKELTDVLKFPLAHEITRHLIIKLLSKAATEAVQYPLLLLKAIPIVGLIIGSRVVSTISFPTSYFMFLFFSGGHD